MDSPEKKLPHIIEIPLYGELTTRLDQHRGQYYCMQHL